ncbi:uncharacterized protein LACBIDRAFT_301570 [Laccaria bicolor S238N-H82]|uniref:Predicted protein n=1 Tax=Laccaria bicolor (strain S238N-H82 / ATCC MYA-4686) TaxID=486041 RepID=B0CNU8_LACBS|nr:uncharacterized protein LACBIDRAFT_301570 [Laccaria bicolor S238N-H82]EDR16005.1 predicted protein [Laccaria bicolor S238N-H82]|eukprot:XP_001874213.1 predicted protein [Laccaria bicolor S238N-H82]
MTGSRGKTHQKSITNSATQIKTCKEATNIKEGRKECTRSRTKRRPRQNNKHGVCPLDKNHIRPRHRLWIGQGTWQSSKCASANVDEDS